MAERPVVNASPLILLAGADLLDLLRLAGNEVIVPSVVADEIKRRGASDVTARALERASWLLIRKAPAVPPIIQAWGLGRGESSVLAWAHANPGAEAIIDDLAGRRCAAAMGIPVRGTLGLVLVAKQRGEIASARSVLEQLRQSGMYLSDRVLNQALTLVGE